MKYAGELFVEKDKAQQLEDACKKPLADCGRGEVLFDEEFTFPNGYRMAVQVVASETPDKETAWTQGVLFNKEGCEVGCTDVGESFTGEYFVWDATDEYLVDVKVKE